MDIYLVLFLEGGKTPKLAALRLTAQFRVAATPGFSTSRQIASIGQNDDS
jgi:hypothetical protein